MIHNIIIRGFVIFYVLLICNQLDLHAQENLITALPNKLQVENVYLTSLDERRGVNELNHVQTRIPVWITSIEPGGTEAFAFRYNHVKNDAIQIRRSGSLTTIPAVLDAQQVLRFQLKVADKDELIYFIQGSDTTGVLFAKVYQKRKERIRIVPLVGGEIQGDSITKYLNSFYKNAGITFEISIEPVFNHVDVSENQLLRNPSKVKDRYTRGMRLLRDLYLSTQPDIKNEYLIFVVPGFVNPSIEGYVARGKSLGFLKAGNTKQLSKSLSEQLEFGMAGISVSEYDQLNRNSTQNLEFWDRIRRHHGIHSYFDDYEDIRTNSGIVAYYFWEEDALGNIRLSGKHPLLNILRPFKKNTFSYHLEIRHFFYKTLFVVKNRTISLVHIILVLICFLSMHLIGKKFRVWFRKIFKHPVIFLIGSRLIEWCLALIIGFFSLGVADLGYAMYEVRSGDIKEFANAPMQTVISEVGSGIHPKKIAEPQLVSEIIVSNNKKYEVRQRNRVLYFNISLDQDGYIEKMQLINSKDSLIVKSLGVSRFAQSHYLVFNYRDFKGNHIKDEVYNHLGVNLTQKMSLDDPPKRILVFVNGYRPATLGSNLEENIKDVQKFGLEFPDSYNRIFSQDVYEYWRPWKAIDALFSARINPAETYYADGHFSVSTSNYRSLIKFTTTANNYPKRCASNNNHHCYEVSTFKSELFGSNKRKTYSLLPLRSNNKGFLKRRENGRVAGRNLLQLLNELPNTSRNDTLYLVAHSMGYAYSLGMLDVLRGQMQFGGYYIIAPENAGAGKVFPKEWLEIWQYGSNFNKIGREAPCLQDGVAPQIAVAGLPSSKRVFIPKRLFKKKGFYDSHFIGYYTWIFDIPNGQRGAIRQH